MRLPINLHQFIKFCVVSGFNTVVDLGSYWILTRYFSWWAHHLVLAHIVSLIITMVHSYAWNSLWVFAKEHTNDIVSFIKFVIVSMSGLVMSSVLFWVMLEIHINDWVVKLSMMFFLFVWNFAGDKWWVYTKK